MKDCADQALVKVGSASIWVPPALREDPCLRLLADADRLLSSPGCQIIKDQKKIKVGRLAMEVRGQVQSVYVKRYNAFSLRYRLGSLFTRSAALRAWRGAATLERAGFLTGRPIAAVEWRTWGMLTKSFYLSSEVPQARTVDVHWREELSPIVGFQGFRWRRAFLRALGELFRSLHQANIYHNDLKDTNIMACPRNGDRDARVYLLDLEGVRTYRRLAWRRRVKNLVQIHRTLGRFLRGSEKLYVLKHYLGEDFLNPGRKRHWVTIILARSAREDRKALVRKLLVLSQARRTAMKSRKL